MDLEFQVNALSIPNRRGQDKQKARYEMRKASLRPIARESCDKQRFKKIHNVITTELHVYSTSMCNSSRVHSINIVSQKLEGDVTPSTWNNETFTTNFIYGRNSKGNLHLRRQSQNWNSSSQFSTSSSFKWKIMIQIDIVNPNLPKYTLIVMVHRYTILITSIRPSYVLLNYSKPICVGEERYYWMIVFVQAQCRPFLNWQYCFPPSRANKP